MMYTVSLAVLISLVVNVAEAKSKELRNSTDQEEDEQYWTTSSYCPSEPSREESKFILVQLKKVSGDQQQTLSSTERGTKPTDSHRKIKPVGYQWRKQALPSTAKEFLNLKDFRHHDRKDLESTMRNITYSCSNVSQMYSIGKSIKGNDLWVMEFSDHPGVHRHGEPEIRLIGNIHGNEVTGREILLNLMKYLCAGYLQNDQRIVNLIRTTRIHILASMNPDGYDIAQKRPHWRKWTVGRYNWQGKDLNRDFPVHTGIITPYVMKQQYQEVLKREEKKKKSSKKEVQYSSIHDGSWGYNAGCAAMHRGDHTTPLQPETKAVVRWMHSIPFVLSGSFHDGGVGAIYPFDSKIEGNFRSVTPDDKVMRFLASTYANAHSDMADPNQYNTDSWCRYRRRDFRRQGGISNGADWFDITGSMEDYSYLATNCYGITFELSCQKWLPSHQLAIEWHKNKEALMSFMESATMGVKGTARDRFTGEPLGGAVIHVSEIFRDVTTTKEGEYWRLLTPGNYTLQARFGEMTSDVKRVEINGSSLLPIVVDFDFF